MAKKNSLLWGLEKSALAARCKSIPACTGHSYVHDMKEPADLDRKSGAEMMVIGEAPGKKEDAMGRPFVGSSGRKIDSALRETGIDRNDVYLSNVVKCRTERDGSNRPPRTGEIQACLPLLKAEITVLKPKVIVALGMTAIRSLTGEKRVGEAIKKGVLEYDGIPVIPTYHPAASAGAPVERAMEIRNLRLDAFKKARKIVHK